MLHARFALALAALLVALLFMGLGCPKAPSTSVRKPGLIDAAPTGDVATIVKTQRDTSRAAQRDLLVVVGAAWCEPCVRFHDAAARGELDDLLANVDLLFFDLDRDGARLDAASYSSRMIPLIVVPDESGRGTERRMEGSIKGAGAVADMSPRVKALLGR